MKILFLHQFFNTPAGGGVLQSYFRAKALIAHHHHVAVITASNEKTYRVENVEGIEVHYLPVPYDNRFGFYKRGLAFLKYVFKASRLSGKFRDFDRCHAISVPLTVGLVARWIKFKYNIPFTFEVGDLWPDAPVEMGYIRNHFLKRRLYNLERSIYREATSVVALSPSIQAAIQAKVPGKKVSMVPNMADCDYFQPEDKSQSLESKFGVKDRFVVSYLGALGEANGLAFMLDCAAASQQAGLPVHFIICGEGAMKESLHRLSSKLELKNLSILPFTNREGVREIMNVTDAVFVTYKPVPILETGSPNKFFEGLSAGKMILINFSGWIRKEMEESGCGIHLDPEIPAEFVERIRTVLADKNLLRKYQQAARRLGEEKFARKKLSEEFVSLFS